MSTDPFAVSTSRLKKLSRYWKDSSYPEAFWDEERLRRRSVERCDFPIFDGSAHRGTLSVVIDPESCSDRAEFRGLNIWERLIVAPDLKTALSCVLATVRQSHLRIQPIRERLDVLRNKGLANSDAARLTLQDLEEQTAMSQLCSALIWTVWSHWNLVRNNRAYRLADSRAKIDRRPEIGARLGLACGPPPRDCRTRRPTPSLEFLSGLLDQGHHLTASQEAADIGGQEE